MHRIIARILPQLTHNETQNLLDVKKNVSTSNTTSHNRGARELPARRVWAAVRRQMITHGNNVQMKLIFFR